MMSHATGRHRRRTEQPIELWDGRVWPGWYEDGLPAFGYKWAPSGLATWRQLRAAGLCPGGQEPYALLIWRGGRRWARLYRLDLARPKRVPSPAQLAALGNALAARRHCPACHEVRDYYIPRSLGRCYECDDSSAPYSGDTRRDAPDTASTAQVAA